jgi:hypothetical protein
MIQNINPIIKNPFQNEDYLIEVSSDLERIFILIYKLTQRSHPTFFECFLVPYFSIPDCSFQSD